MTTKFLPNIEKLIVLRMGSDGDYYRMCLILVEETEKAMLLKEDEMGNSQWIPKSVLNELGRDYYAVEPWFQAKVHCNESYHIFNSALSPYILQAAWPGCYEFGLIAYGEVQLRVFSVKTDHITLHSIREQMATRLTQLWKNSQANK